MLEQLDQIESQALAALNSLNGEKEIEAWRVAHLGRSSPLMEIFDNIGQLSKEERPAVGKRANEVKRALESALEARTEALAAGGPGAAPWSRSAWM